MKIKEVQDKVTDYDEHEPVDPNHLAKVVQNERKINVFNAENNDFDKTLTNTIAKVPSVRETEQGDISMTKPIRSELITFGTKLFIKLQDKLLDITEPDQSANPQPDVIVLQSSRTNSKSSLQSSKFEHAEPRRIEDIYNDVFKNASHIKETIATFVEDARAPVGDVSVSASHLQPKAKEKNNKKSLPTSTADWNVHKVSLKNDAKEKQDSVINTVVSISIPTLDMDTESKKIIDRVESTDTSNESMFFIKKNSQDDSETDIEMYTDAKRTETKQSIYNQLKLLQLEEDIKAVNILEKKLINLQTAVPQPHSNRFFEKGVRRDLEQVVERDKSAGDTFEILSDATDNNLNEDHTETNVMKTKIHDVTHHKRPSFTTNRKSKALKRKDLLSYISKAQAALQKSKLALDDSESTDNDTRDVSRKSSQKSNKVLKTSQFDDESYSEGSLIQCSRLKRTVFGESSYMRETKGNAIPIHYKNVSKQNKKLMVETVMADKSVSMNPCMQSMKIQANLFTYCQEEFDSESYSNSGSNLDLDKLTSVTSTVASKVSEAGSLQNLVTFSGNSSEFADSDFKSGHLDRPVEEPSEVLVFDHLNPLNNILLRPINNSEARKNNPMKGDEKVCDPKQNSCIDKHCNQASKNDTTTTTRPRAREFEVRTVNIKQHRFTPKTAQEARQRIRFSTPYSVNTKQPRVEIKNMTKSSEDPLQNRFSLNPNACITKVKKRICSVSPDKHKYHKSLKTTPKPKTKVQKISNNPKVKFKVPEELCSASLHCLPQEKHKMQSTKRNAYSSKIRAKICSKAKVTKPEQNIFVQQLIADYIGFYTDYENKNDYNNKLQDDNKLNLHPKTESSTAFSQSGLSFSSSKNLNPMNVDLSTSNQSIRQGPRPEPSPPKVLVFDYINSLNNVLLVPLDVTEAHKYNPMKTEEAICDSKCNPSIGIHNNQESKNYTTKDFEVQTMTFKQHRDMPRPTKTQEGQRNRFSKPLIVNTKEQAVEINSIANFSEITLQDHKSTHSQAKMTKGKKCIPSSSSDKHRHLSFIDINRKPVTKTQNISSSPKVKIKVPLERPLHRYESAHSIMPEKNDTKNTDRKAHRPKTRGKRSSTSKMTNLGQTKTAEQFISDYTGDTNLKHKDHDKNLLDDANPDLNLKSESLSAISQSGLTFTLSKNLNPTNDDVLIVSNTEYRSPRQSIIQDTPDCPDELICTTSSIKYDSDSGVNVVAKIDMLPFMGSQECEWETSPADTWSFRLLNGRLRLTARLAHRLHNATRTRVRGDTPLLDISVAIVQYDRVDLVARMCARFACETLRQMVACAVRRKCYASDIPPLLRRCAAVVRVALRWKRAMYDAKVRLAYSLDSCGKLSLKVANIPLRSVWEVTMRIGLVSDDASSVPCPRASDVRVQPVVSDVLVPAADVRRALLHTPKDWGNVPSTIWRIYRLLKHKKRDDELFLA